MKRLSKCEGNTTDVHFTMNSLMYNGIGYEILTVHELRSGKWRYQSTNQMLRNTISQSGCKTGRNVVT